MKYREEHTYSYVPLIAVEKGKKSPKANQAKRIANQIISSNLQELKRTFLGYIKQTGREHTSQSTIILTVNGPTKRFKNQCKQKYVQDTKLLVLLELREKRVYFGIRKQ